MATVDNPEENDQRQLNPEEEKIIAKNRIAQLTQQLNEYRESSVKYAKEATLLRSELKKNDLKTTEMVAYLRNETQKRDLELVALKSQITSLKEAAAHHEQEMRRKIREEATQADEKLTKTRQSLLEKIEAAKREVESLNYFKDHKNEIETTLLAARTTIEQQAKRFRTSVDNLEHKFLLDTERIREAADNKVLEIKKKAREEAERAMDAQSTKLRTDNHKMRADLKFHQQLSTKLQAENEELRKDVIRFRREKDLYSQKDEEYAKQAVHQKKKIQALAEKSSNMEVSLTKTMKQIEEEKKQIILQHNAALTNYKVEGASTKEAVKVLKRELHHVRKHARTLMEDRTDCFQFFHEALQQVKGEIFEQQQVEYQLQREKYYRTLNEMGLSGNTAHFRLPKIHKNQPTQIVSKPLPPSGKVKLSELTSEDRERVLQLLLVKMQNKDKSKFIPATMPMQPKAEVNYEEPKTFLTQ